MSAPATATVLKPAPAIAKAPAALLQRKCACGKGGAGVSGECEECRRDKLMGVQTKLLVGASDDPLEHEADRAAERVLAMPLAREAGDAFPGPVDGRPPLATSAPPAFGPDLRQLSMQAESPAPALQDVDLSHGGAPLTPGLRRFFESRFGRDLSDVRVHTGGRAESWNDGLNAHAFTYGNHVWLGRGHQPAANFLLAHELAHVIQQRQPRSLQRPGPTEVAPELSGASPALRRLELGMPFWVPLGAKGKKGGSAIHQELLEIAQANNKNLDIEAPAPNANAKGAGLGLQGSIDLYQGKNAKGFHAKVGLFFDGPTGALNADVQATTPKKHRRANVAGIAAGEFNPFVTAGGGIDGITRGPKSVQIGELKPAAKPILDKGEQQIENYREGMKDAARLTNDWAPLHRSSDRWKLTSTAPLPDAAVKFVRNGKDMKFNPSSPRDDENLVLATVAESSIGGKYEVKTRFNPAEHGLPPIKGGLYAQLFQPGKGLWTYFARPKDLAGALKLARSTLIKGEMTLANQTQQEVIDLLLKAPKKITPLRRDRHAQPETPIGAQPAAPVIRRAVKTPQLKDEFKLAEWKNNQAALREKISGPTASAETKKQMASLELLERAYEAEEALDKVPGTGKSTLPAKSTDVVNIVSGSGAERKTHKRNLADMASWLKGWTSKPAEILGLFRDKFGDSFVWVANKVVDLRERIREKYRNAFEKHPSKPAAGKGRIIAKALLKALLQVAKVLIPRAAHLFMDAVVAGIKKKLAAVFDLDPVKMAEDTFGAEFKQWNDKLGQYKDDADKYVDDIVEAHTKDLAWIKDVMDKAKTIGPILEAAAIMLQCGKKPGWNCLLLLSQKFRECGMEAALNICEVQKQIAGIVAVVGPLADLPATLAQKSLDVVKDAAPDGLKDIFSEPVGKSGKFNSDDIECEDTPAETTCPGLLPLSPTEVADEKGEKPSDKQEQKPSEQGKGEEKAEPQPGSEGEKSPQADKPGGAAGEGKPAGQPGKAPGKQAPPGEPGAEGEPGTSGAGGEKETPSQQAPGEQPAPGQPRGDKSGGPGAQPGEPQPGGGEQGQDQSGGGQQALESLPAPEEVHKALNELLNEQGPQRLEALAKLAEAAGMPGDAPLTAEQVKKLQELLKKGALTAKDLQDLAAGKAKAGTQRKAGPLDKFLGEEAHKAVMQQTLEKLRQKQYDFKFDEMAKLKVHWKILVPYKPGPFRNAPALMWTEQIRAAGVVDGEFGECYDGGKLRLKVTRADMREEGTELPVTVQTPFNDPAAKLSGGTCPTPPKPKPKGGGAGKDQDDEQGKDQRQGRQQQQDEQDQGEGEAGKGQGMGPGDEQVPPDEQGKSEGQGHGEVDSRAEPSQNESSARGESDQGESGQGEQEQEEEQEGGKADADKGEQPRDQDSEEPEQGQQKSFPLDVGALAGGCGFPPECAQEPWLVDFEELGATEDGYQVMPDKGKDPDGTGAMLNPPNALSPFSVRSAADGSLEMVMTCEGKTCVVGIVKASPVRAGMHELVSGPLLDSLRALLRRFIQEKRNGSKGRAERIHFF